MIKNIVFDMGNVLVRYDPEGVLREQGLSDADVEEIMKNFYGRGFINQTDRGDKTHEQVIDEAREFLPERLINVLRSVYVDQVYGVKYQPPYEEMCELLLKLRENGYKLYLLSNAGTDFYVYSKCIPALKMLDGGIISSEYHLLKPQPEIYQKLFEKCSLKAEECVFIDDVQTNVDGAASVGMSAIRHSSRDETPQALEEKLRKIGVQI